VILRHPAGGGNGDCFARHPRLLSILSTSYFVDGNQITGLFLLLLYYKY